MAMRIIGIPDDDGIIRVSCGGETIEIQVVTRAAGGAGPAQPARDLNPFDDPFTRMVRDLRTNPFDLPSSYITAPQAGDGRVDVDRLIDEVRRQFADPGRPDPLGVVVSAVDANIHELGRLGGRIADEVSRLALAVDFRGLGKP